MLRLLIWTTAIILSGIIVASGTVKVFPPPSLIPSILGLVWIIALETTVIVAGRSTK